MTITVGFYYKKSICVKIFFSRRDIKPNELNYNKRFQILQKKVSSKTAVNFFRSKNYNLLLFYFSSTVWNIFLFSALTAGFITELCNVNIVIFHKDRIGNSCHNKNHWLIDIIDCFYSLIPSLLFEYVWGEDWTYCL